MKPEGLLEGDEPTESLHGTVFIGGKKQGNPDEQFRLQLPDPTQSRYRPEEIFHLRGIIPDSIPPVTEAIKTAPVRSGTRRG
jgi:hypothetical protein